MFNIEISLNVKIAGCPESGLPAVDFRRLHGLPEAPHNSMKLEWNGVDESICRIFDKYLTNEANLILKSGSSGPDYHTATAAYPLVSPESEYSGSRHGQYAIPPEAISDFLSSKTTGIVTLVRALEKVRDADDLRLAEVRRQRAEKTALEKAEREKSEQDYKARELEKVKRKQEGVEKLKNWALEEGSELIQMRIQGGYDWENEAGKEYAKLIISKLEMLPELESDNPDGYSYDTEKECTAPNIQQMAAHFNVEENSEGLPVATELVNIRYTPDEDEDEDEDDDREPIWRTELQVTVTDPRGTEHLFYYLPDRISVLCAS